MSLRSLMMPACRQRQVFQIAHQAQLEEHHRIYALLATVTIIGLGLRVEEVKVEHVLQTAVETVLRNTLAQLEMVEELLLIGLFSLHT